jgi:hypothetical protein
LITISVDPDRVECVPSTKRVNIRECEETCAIPARNQLDGVDHRLNSEGAARLVQLGLCSAHGLRKAAATVAAENGATAHELMAIFGWLSLKEAERYTRGAERKKLAERGMGIAGAAQSENGKCLTLRPRVSNLIDFKKKNRLVAPRR